MPFAPMEKVTNDPAAGAEASWTADERTTIRCVFLTLVTSAAVANRTVNLVVKDDQGVVVFRQPINFNQTASQTIRYCFFHGAALAAPMDGTATSPLPFELEIPVGWKIETLTTAKDAGDNYDVARLLVERA